MQNTHIYILFTGSVMVTQMLPLRNIFDDFHEEESHFQ
jgi:hypothetical protein